MFERDAFAEAKRLSLVAFFEQYVAPPVRAPRGRQALFDTCPNCGPARQKGRDRVSVRDDAKWHCFACGQGGSIVDAACFLWGVEPLAAARQLAGNRELPGPAHDASQLARWRAREEAQQVSVRAALQAIFEATRRSWDLGVEHWLVERGITREVVTEVGRRGLLGAMPSDPDPATEWLLKVVGAELLAAAGLWKHGKARPWIAYRPLVFFLPGLNSAEFRRIPRAGVTSTAGSKSISVGRHDAPYWWSRPSDRCLLVEGMIDLMSGLALGFPGCIMGFAGVNNWRIEWLVYAAQRHGIRRFEIAFDNDIDADENQGQLAAARLQRACTDAGLTAMLCPPLIGDLNDLLRTRRTAQPSAIVPAFTP